MNAVDTDPYRITTSSMEAQYTIALSVTGDYFGDVIGLIKLFCYLSKNPDRISILHLTVHAWRD
jgi:hypothetical protein